MVLIERIARTQGSVLIHGLGSQLMSGSHDITWFARLIGFSELPWLARDHSGSQPSDGSQASGGSHVVNGSHGIILVLNLPMALPRTWMWFSTFPWLF